MDDKIVLSEYGRDTENDLEKTFITLEPVSTRRTNAFENVRNEFRPQAYEEILNYPSQSAANNCSLLMQDKWTEVQLSNAIRLFTQSSFNWQNNFQDVITNSGLEYNEFSRVNREVQESEKEDSVNISVVGHCIRSACDCLLGINSQHNDDNSENIASQSEGSILSELNSFNPKGDPSVLQNEKFDVNVSISSESKSLSTDSKKDVFNFDTINSGFNFPETSMNSNQLTEINNFLTLTSKPISEKIYCKKCLKTFNKKFVFLKHKCGSTGDNFMNGKSKNNVYQEEQQTKHNRKKTEDASVQCDVCKKTFSCAKKLLRHMRTHTGEKPFQCNVCEKRFSNSSNLNVHMRTHTGEKPFQCNVCEKRFSRSSILNDHMRRHTGEKHFQCDLCEKRFSTSAELTHHKRVHTGEKPFQCNVCEKRFSHLGNLNVHMRTHTGEKDFECNVCEKRFSRSSSLNDHMQRHTGEKHFQCNICKKRFATSTELNVHMRTHTGEKPFQCPSCKLKFSQRCNLKKHMLTHTRQNSF
ncbi:zinc finger protein 16 [Trichonephila inaurata madagascariensis]|uniref:Zinc finger protein 16 n=1 Tax=Trichonephila inaurata madagascariensis TaxID=2747483 RepID=A0A8X6X0R7_9ARAC|nr:zinc finger protein 16 [Trichonephila inaurata madagascariensis]